MPRRPASAFPRDADPTFAHPLADRLAAAALALLPGVGPVRWRALLAEHAGNAADARRAHGASAAEWAAALCAAERALTPRSDRDAVLLAGDAEYPPRLLELPDPPPLLWCRGEEAPLAATPVLAIVGTRQNSVAGARITRRLVEAVAHTGACIVSGLARGIDGVAHDAALAAGLPTVAVLGTGVDVPYPALHRRLYDRIAGAGTILSEQPPGATALPGAFPRRNRIIAALADVTLVIEAGDRSGALITADVALDLGRTVAAVPGPMDAPASLGANALLRDGAHVIASPDDLVTLLSMPASSPVRPCGPTTSRRRAPCGAQAPHTSAARPSPPPHGRTLDGLEPDERALWDALAEPAADPDVAANRAGLSARRCATALAVLELRGVVHTELTGELRRA